MTRKPVLYDYWRSSASFRVRIALNLLGMEYEARPVNLLADEQKSQEYLALNPQGILPTLLIDGNMLTQSLAIIEYLHGSQKGSCLLPAELLGQYRVRQLSYAVAMEIHPVCNLGVAAHVAELTNGGDQARKAWMQRFINNGLAGLEGLLAQGDAKSFCYGDTPTMADCCLVPQLYNADRWGVDFSGYPNISRIGERLRNLDAFARAHPDQIGVPRE